MNSLKQKKGRALFVLQASRTKGKDDVVGSKFLKQFEQLKSGISKLDFKIISSGWHWSCEGNATFWVYLPAKPLSSKKIIEGPPINMPDVFIKQFKKKWKKVFIKNKRYIAKTKRKIILPREVIKIAASALKLKLLTK
ncbi:MAG: hypothetical protein HYT16_02320 [DPANN group archaeon]|nr:hypothetical protein [DPANN group archaeon]